MEWSDDMRYVMLKNPTNDQIIHLLKFCQLYDYSYEIDTECFRIKLMWTDIEYFLNVVKTINEQLKKYSIAFNELQNISVTNFIKFDFGWNSKFIFFENSIFNLMSSSRIYDKNYLYSLNVYYYTNDKKNERIELLINDFFIYRERIIVSLDNVYGITKFQKDFILYFVDKLFYELENK